MDGKIVLVTGANSGIGLATATALAKQGAQVVMVARSRERGEAALAQAKRESGSSKISLMLADLSRQSDVKQLAETFKRTYSQLDVLINNAAIVPPERTVTDDGLEMQFAVNHLAYFILTNALLDLLKRSPQGRIVNVSSEAHREGVIDFNDLQNARQYHMPRYPVPGWQAYSNTKLMNVLFTHELARRLEGTNVVANSLHPGVIRTELTRGMNRFVRGLAMQFMIRMSAERGARTVIYLASAPQAAHMSGKYFHDNCNEVQPSDAARNPETAFRLWEASAAIANIQPNLV